MSSRTKTWRLWELRPCNLGVGGGLDWRASHPSRSGFRSLTGRKGLGCLFEYFFVTVFWGVGLGVALGPGHGVAQSGVGSEARCRTLLEQAAGHLAAEQYPTMLKVAEDRQRVCPGPVSEFLVGLAEANMVDQLLVKDPAERERMRQDALRALKVASAGGHALRPMWRFTAHDWIVYLQRLGPGGGGGDGATRASRPPVPKPTDTSGSSASAKSLTRGAAPPPQRGEFPWGPVTATGVGVGLLTSSIVLYIASRNQAADANDRAKALDAEQREPLSSDADWRAVKRDLDSAKTKFDWSIGLRWAGGLAVAGGVAWYLFLPPEGNWSWAATPTGLQLTGRF